MAKSNLKTINNNYITQSSNLLLFSKNNLAYINYLYLSFLFFFNNFLFYRFFFEKNSNMFVSIFKKKIIFLDIMYAQDIFILNNLSYNMLFKIYLFGGRYVYVYDMFYLLGLRKIKSSLNKKRLVKSFLKV